MAGITSVHAAEKSVFERAKDKVREVIKEVNTPVRPPRNGPAVVIAVRG